MRRKRFATTMRAFVLLATLAAIGCAGPEISFNARTRIAPDGRTHRAVVVTSEPARGRPPEEAALERYLRLPPQDAYEQYEAGPRRAVFSGEFETAAQTPVDFAKRTVGLDLWAQNRMRVRLRDYVLLTTYDFEERVEDIVERAEADEALDEALGLLVEALLSALEARFGETYDLERFKEWVRRETPLLVRRVYQIAWEIRRGRRGGLDAEREEAEWDRRIRQEISRYGLYLRPFDDRSARDLNEQRAWAFLDARLSDLVEPRQSGAPPLTSAAFRGGANQKILLAHLEEAVRDSFGGLESFLEEIDPLIPVVFGSFFPHRLRLDHRAPAFRFTFRLRLPGRVLLTNGVRELDGAILWRFEEEEVRLSGFPMWARSLRVDERAAARLGLAGFPGSIEALERFLLTMTGADGAPDAGLRRLLAACVEAGDLAPLRRAALPGGSDQVSDPDLRVAPGRAQALLGMLSAFYDPGAAKPAGSPEADAPTPDTQPASPDGPAGEGDPGGGGAPYRPDGPDMDGDPLSDRSPGRGDPMEADGPGAPGPDTLPPPVGGRRDGGTPNRKPARPEDANEGGGAAPAEDDASPPHNGPDPVPDEPAPADEVADPDGVDTAPPEGATEGLPPAPDPETLEHFPGGRDSGGTKAPAEPADAPTAPDRPAAAPGPDLAAPGREERTARPAEPEADPDDWRLDWPPAVADDAPDPESNESAPETIKQGDDDERDAEDARPRPAAGNTESGSVRDGIGRTDAAERGSADESGDVPAIPLRDGDADADAPRPHVQPDDE